VHPQEIIHSLYTIVFVLVFDTNKCVRASGIKLGSIPGSADRRSKLGRTPNTPTIIISRKGFSRLATMIRGSLSLGNRRCRRRRSSVPSRSPHGEQQHTQAAFPSREQQRNASTTPEGALALVTRHGLPTG
jgi:hypothetical protein